MPRRRLPIFNSMSALKRGRPASAERIIMIRSLNVVYLTLLEERLLMNGTMRQRKAAKVLGVGRAYALPFTGPKGQRTRRPEGCIHDLTNSERESSQYAEASRAGPAWPPLTRFRRRRRRNASSALAAGPSQPGASSRTTPQGHGEECPEAPIAGGDWKMVTGVSHRADQRGAVRQASASIPASEENTRG